MALLDPDQNCIVIRVVYDGPALAGKTTSLKALGSSLELDVFSADEADGRTLFFDWLDYVGGRFEGMPIRCQIISVPGQRVLDQRRRLLLETADVVVFVANSQPEQQAENLRTFGLLREVLAPLVPAVGIVVQANKRDAPDAVSIEALRSTLGDNASLAVTETVAEQSEGIRETFVLAVRLALDRVRVQWKEKTLPKQAPEVDQGDQLYAAIQAIEQEGLSTRATLGLGGGDRRVRDTPPKPTEADQEVVRNGVPPLPDDAVPPGSVWPPIKGRVALFDAAREHAVCRRHRNGDWVALSPGWKRRSSLKGLFFDLEEGTEALLKWARWHTAAGTRLSPSRCVVLHPEATHAWRLWQVIRRVKTLRQTIQELLAQPDDRLLGEGLFGIIDHRLQAERDWVATGWLSRLDLDCIGATAEGAPFFTGFVPFPATLPASPHNPSFDEKRLVREELGPELRSELALIPRRIPAVLDSIQQVAKRRNREGVASSIRQVLLLS